MARAEMVWTFARELLERVTGEPVTVDDDGDLRFTLGGGTYFLRVMGEDAPIVRVFAVALETEKTPQLLELLNEMNSRLAFARMFWVHGQVLVESDHGGMTINADDLMDLCGSVAQASDAVVPMLAERFGGPVVWTDQKQDDYRPPRSDFPGYI